MDVPEENGDGVMGLCSLYQPELRVEGGSGT